MEKKTVNAWRVVAVIAMILCLALAIWCVSLVSRNRAETKQPIGDGEVLASWASDSVARDALISYVSAVTQEGGEDFIPAEDRIAVFDMDGTLTCETYYTYYDTMMFIEYCLVDHPERVSDELKQVAASIKPGYVADENLARNFARAYAGMTVEELYQYAVEFGQKKTESFNNMRYIDNFYIPMVELVKYLYDNGFTVYVISGTERTTTRAIVANSPIRDYVTPNHVIGTAFEVKQPGHETEASNMDFKYANGDELVLTGGFIQKNLNANKSIWIEREIGQRPVLAFGNSGSDTSMMNYTIDSRNPYRAQAYMIVADDDVREWGTQDWAAKSADYEAKGYIPISMKNDFAQIYAEGITKADQQYLEHDWSDASWYQAASSDEPQTQAADVILSDDSSDFVLLSEAVPDAILEIRYYSTYNFVGDRIDGYEEPLAMLTTEAAAALREVSDELMDMGYRLKIFDAYRPQMAVTHFMNWALDTEDTRMKEYFYPDLDKDVLFPQGYIAEHSGHSRGSTVDLTLFDMNTEREVDMGGTFDFFGELSHPDYTDITEEQYAMRMLLREVMMKHGFRPLEEEWWHFTLNDEPYPDTYFTFPINSDSLAQQLDQAA
ncbi:MAG: haloacid dehalogenase-like hydrolase [Oscillospiraceae bacterium]|nr:haloacid dehalogenase-like hydrolase [Oscillospiraceae bacterium]